MRYATGKLKNNPLALWLDDLQDDPYGRKRMTNEQESNPCKEIEMDDGIDHQTREHKKQREQDTEWKTTSDCAFDGSGGVSRISHERMREIFSLIELTSVDKITIVAGETTYYYELVRKE